MTDPQPDPSVEFEPHLRSDTAAADPSEQTARKILEREAAVHPTRDAVEHTVWDEPALLAGRAGPAPEGQLTYARWLQTNIAETSWAQSLRVTLGLVLCAGPWGVLGVFVNGLSQGDLSTIGFLAVVLLGPVTEEITKVAATLWVIEKRPFWFKASGQILLCAAAGGIVFAAIENLIYLRVYIPTASDALARWRWTICTLMHVCCSSLVGVGLVRIWHRTMQNKTRPALADAVPCLTAAMLIHAGYNLLAVLGEATGWLRLE